MDEARSRDIVLRLLGGLAVKYHCPSASHRALQRYYPDLDFFGTGKQSQPIRKLFRDLGYQPNQRFNALQGETRLMFEDAANQRRVDIFLDVFHMCHTLHIGKRLTVDDYTIPISDLLLTKLQILEINEKDVRDIIAILQDHDVVDSPPKGDKERIDGTYIGGLCSVDWGLCHTITLTLRKIPGFTSQYDLLPEERATVESRIVHLLKVIDHVPKSLKWKLRAAVGEKVRWHDLPEIPVRTQQA